MHDELAGLLRTCLIGLGRTPAAQIRLRPVRRGRPGDWSTAVARTLAEPGRDAERLVTALADRLRSEAVVTEVHTEHGYLTLTLSTAALTGGVHRLLRDTHATTASPPATGPRPAADRGWPADLLPVAFAHARCRNVARAARAHGVRPFHGELLDSALRAVVDQEHTRDLLVRLGAQTPGDRGGAVLLRDLAATFQDFYVRTRTAPRGAEPVTSTHRTHLALTEATAVALATGLSSLSLYAPEHL